MHPKSALTVAAAVALTGGLAACGGTPAGPMRSAPAATSSVASPTPVAAGQATAAPETPDPVAPATTASPTASTVATTAPDIVPVPPGFHSTKPGACVSHAPELPDQKLPRWTRQSGDPGAEPTRSAPTAPIEARPARPSDPRTVCYLDDRSTTGPITW